MAYKKPSKPVGERLAKYTVVTPGCWIWTGHKNDKGYGMLTLNKKLRTAHRVSFEFYVGPIPEGGHVLHTCDNPECVNPDHLRLGTHQDNMKERQERDRTAHGEKLSHLTAEIVADIYYAKGLQSDIAKTYGVSTSTVYAIKAKTRWKRMTDKLDEH